MEKICKYCKHADDTIKKSTAIYCEEWRTFVKEDGNCSRFVPNTLSDTEAELYTLLKENKGYYLIIASLPKRYRGAVGSLKHKGLVEFRKFQLMFVNGNIETIRTFVGVKLVE